MSATHLKCSHATDKVRGHWEAQAVPSTPGRGLRCLAGSQVCRDWQWLNFTLTCAWMSC